MIYNLVNEVNQSNFFLLIFKKVPQKYRGTTAVLLICKYRYRYRGTNFSKVPSTGTAVLLQSTVPTYATGTTDICTGMNVLHPTLIEWCCCFITVDNTALRESDEIAYAQRFGSLNLTS